MALSEKTVEELSKFAAIRKEPEQRPVKEPIVKDPPPIEPTPERMRRQSSHKIPGTRAVKLVPVIDTMLTRGQITDKQYIALAYYRDQASLADRSPLKSCIDFSVTGGDSHPSAALASAMLETSRIERDMGSVWQIARAVAVDDVSLTEWCCAHYGSRERYNSDGNVIAIVPMGYKSMEFALMDLKHAAGRIVK